MTCRELRDKLAEFDEKARVVVYAEDKVQHFLEIDDVSTQSGTPRRLENGKAAFQFASDGPECWLFIIVSEA